MWQNSTSKPTLQETDCSMVNLLCKTLKLTYWWKFSRQVYSLTTDKQAIKERYVCNRIVVNLVCCHIFLISNSSKAEKGMVNWQIQSNLFWKFLFKFNGDFRTFQHLLLSIGFKLLLRHIQLKRTFQVCVIFEAAA